MRLNELRYDKGDFSNLEIGDLVVVFQGDVTVLHLSELDEAEVGKALSLLKALCGKFGDMQGDVFEEDGSLRGIYSKNGYMNIGYAVLQFSGFPNMLIGEVEEGENGWCLSIGNEWYDVRNSKELRQLMDTGLLDGSFDCMDINGEVYPINGAGQMNVQDIPLANPLYHGTIEKYLDSILRQGIRKVQANSAFNANNEGFVFLTSDFATANEYAQMYARKFNSNGVVLEVNSDRIDKDKVVLDYDFTYAFGKSGDKSPFTGNKIGTANRHKGDFIDVDGRHGSKYGKLGYKGIVMPAAIERITFIKDGREMTRNEYLGMARNTHVKEGVNEWYYPEGFKGVSGTIRLYHGTDYYGLDDILTDGVIDARSGRRTGETRGMNWFTTEYSENFSRGFVFSIDVDVSEINKSANGFKFMNDREVANYEPINIKGRNLTIVKAFGVPVEELKGMVWGKCLEKAGGDPYEAVFMFTDRLSALGWDGIMVDSPVVLQVIRQVAGEGVLRSAGIVEGVWHVNEVDAKDISLKSFEVKDELHPKFWVNGKLNSRVRLRLLDIADDFIDTLATDWVKPKDVVFTGSLANYNWSKYSDIDVHVLMDYGKVYKKAEFVEDYFTAKKEMWLNEHPDLKIYGFPVEMYVEDVNNESYSSGVYSLYKNKWLKEPCDFQDAKLNGKYIKEYAAKVMTQIDDIEKKQSETDDSHKTETYRNQLKKIFDKLKKLRKESLSKVGEMGSGNIIFKILRRAKYIDKIWDLINTSYDRMNSLDEAYYRNTMTNKAKWFDGEPNEPAEYGGRWEAVKPLDGWVCVGTVKDMFDEFYILVDPNAEKDMKDFDGFIRKHVSVNKDADGKDGFTNLQSKMDGRSTVYDIYGKYKGTYYDMLFNGITDEYREMRRNDYLSRCVVVNGNVIARHDSSVKITDGYVKPTSHHNLWSSATDWGAYFWLSKNRGGDPSNGGVFTYFCQIPLDEIYFRDSSKLSDGGKADDKSILREYPYIAGEWVNRGAVACQTYKPTPIWCIRTIVNGRPKWFNKTWNEIPMPDEVKGMY